MLCCVLKVGEQSIKFFFFLCRCWNEYASWLSFGQFFNILNLGRKKTNDGRGRNGFPEKSGTTDCAQQVSLSENGDLATASLFMLDAFPLDRGAPERSEFWVSTSIPYENSLKNSLKFALSVQPFEFYRRGSVEWIIAFMNFFFDEAHNCLAGLCSPVPVFRWSHPRVLELCILHLCLHTVLVFWLLCSPSHWKGI